MPNRPRSGPLDGAALNALALAYVSRYATTRIKLTAYLKRKIRERSWANDDEIPPVEEVVVRCVALGYVDDTAFAETRSAALSRRGYGSRRIGAALAAAGIDRGLAADLAHDEHEAAAAADIFARRRRIGRYATGVTDEAARRRALAAMLRAGHRFDIARRLVDETGDPDPPCAKD